jgi:hypothetical protein
MFFLYIYNHREYIKKVIKLIVKEKYKEYEKIKKLIYYSKQQNDCLKFLITPQLRASKCCFEYYCTKHVVYIGLEELLDK